MVYGAMGGDGQPQTQAVLFSRYAFYGMDLQTAISAPRWLLGRTWGESRDSLRLESRFSDELLDALTAAGHPVGARSAIRSGHGHARRRSTFKERWIPRCQRSAQRCALRSVLTSNSDPMRRLPVIQGRRG